MIRNRQEFKEYCLRSLGAPVVQVDVTDDQLEDRIDEAIDFWQQYNNEGTLKCFLKQKITPSVLHVQEFVKDGKCLSGEIHGVTSGAKARVCTAHSGIHSQNCDIYCRDIKGDFIAGEKIHVGCYEYTLIDHPKCVEKGIIDEHKIKIPDYILGVTKIIPYNNAASSRNLFDVEFQFRMNSLVDVLNTDIINYTMMMKHYDLLQFQLNAKPDFEFNRHEGYIYPIYQWDSMTVAGSYMIMEAYRMVDPNESWKAWNDRWLKRYTIALIKKQWATNLKKFSGVQLAGGVTLNGQEMYQEAREEVQALEEEMFNNLPPSCFAIG